MIGPALRQLFDDLESAVDKSPYENALLDEIRPLVTLSEGMQPIEKAIGTRVATEGSPSGSQVSLPRFLVTRILDAFSGNTEFAFNPPGERLTSRGYDDIVRLRCRKPDCPNKRL